MRPAAAVDHRADGAGLTDARTGSDPLSEPALTRAGAPRLELIDRLRGLMIALMVLDHTREFLQAQALVFDPTDPARTTLALYVTRWVTHLCAPTFVFLAGASVRLQREAGRSPAALARYLLTRGFWLILLEVTVIGFGFNFAEPFLFLQVIWAIGVGFILLAGLAWVRPVVVLAVGGALVAGHALLPGAPVGGLGDLWRAAILPGAVPFGLPGLVAYPVLPWFGILCVGYGAGGVFLLAPHRRRRVLLLASAAALAVFACLRVLNGYGDPRPWSAQQDGLRTALSFLNLSKYPPSLDYVLATLGVSLALAVPLARLPSRLVAPLLSFGRTPLLTYLLHIYLTHTLTLAVGLAQGLPAHLFWNYLGDPSGLKSAHWGVGLGWVYAAWLAIMAMLYPLSRWYAALKSRRRDWWLAYL